MLRIRGRSEPMNVEAAGRVRGLRRLRALRRLDLDNVFGHQHDVTEAFDVGLDALDLAALSASS